MIDLLSGEQVEELIEQRKQEFELDSAFYVFTPRGHAFRFWADGDLSIRNSSNDYRSSSHQPEIAKLYGVEYDNRSTYIESPATRKHLYNLFINDPTCLFFHNWNELEQELQHRGLI